MKVAAIQMVSSDHVMDNLLQAAELLAQAAAFYSQQLRGNERAAIGAAARALMHSGAVSIRFLAGRTFVEAGDTAAARRQIDSLADEILLEPQAHARILEGQLALKGGNARDAVRLLQEANRQSGLHFQIT